MAKIVLDPYVESELLEIWDYIARDNPDAATRVVEAAYATFEEIAAHPRIGRLRRFRNAKLRGIRSRHIAGFSNYIIFYDEKPGLVRIHHVFHGARDIERLFAR